jgi:hypothetical protein
LVLLENHAPQLLEKSNRPPVIRPEWNIKLPKGDMDQVDELLDTIAAHKEMGVTGASVMFSFFKRRVQPIQQRHILGFEYMGAEDPSRMCAEELTDEAALIRVKRVLLDVNAVPYILELFSARTPPKPVSIRLLLRATPAVLPLLTENLLQGLTELYRSYPPQPDVPRLDHLLPSTAAEAKRARVAEALPGSESTDIFRLQSTRFSTRARAPRDGNGSSSFGDRIGYHCRGGHRATSWCHPAASNKYHEGEEGCHEEVFAVSVHLVA